MHWVALSKLSLENGSLFNLAGVEYVDSEHEEGARREVVVVIERAKIVVFIVLAYRLCVLALLGSVY